MPSTIRMDTDMFKVQKTQCNTCIYRPDSPLNLEKLEADIADPYGGFNGHRICHHTEDVCCAGFWARHKDKFQLGQIAQRLDGVELVDEDNQRHLLGKYNKSPSTGEKQMKLSKTLENAVCLAQWCINNKLDPRQVGELRTLVNRHANTWCRQNNREIDFDKAEKRMEKLTGQINKLAAEMKITDMDWPGLYPTFTTPAGFRNSMLPEV